MKRVASVRVLLRLNEDRCVKTCVCSVHGGHCLGAGGVATDEHTQVFLTHTYFAPILLFFSLSLAFFSLAYVCLFFLPGMVVVSWFFFE